MTHFSASAFAVMVAVSIRSVASVEVIAFNGDKFLQLKVNGNKRSGQCVSAKEPATTAFESAAYKMYECRDKCAKLGSACTAFDYQRDPQKVRCRFYDVTITESGTESQRGVCVIRMPESTVVPATINPAPTTQQPVTQPPATSQPATTQPATTQPATTQPATTRPPATTQPATTTPVPDCKNEFAGFCSLPELGALLESVSPKCQSYLQYFLLQSGVPTDKQKDSLHCGCFLEMDAGMAMASTCIPNANTQPIKDQYSTCKTAHPDFLRPNFGVDPVSIQEVAAQVSSLSAQLAKMQKDIVGVQNGNTQQITGTIVQTCQQ